MAADFDLIVSGGTVVDPSQNLHGLHDIAIKDGRIVGIGAFEPSMAAAVLDARGLVVTPGIVDMHVHVYEGVSHYGVDADENCIHKGVTTVLDAGSSGAQTFPGFREYVIDRVRTRVFALMNISASGMISDVVGELEDLRWADPAETLEDARAASRCGSWCQGASREAHGRPERDRGAEDGARGGRCRQGPDHGAHWRYSESAN